MVKDAKFNAYVLLIYNPGNTCSVYMNSANDLMPIKLALDIPDAEARAIADNYAALHNVPIHVQPYYRPK